MLLRLLSVSKPNICFYHWYNKSTTKKTMSILYESDNCVLISHENYINKIYSNVDNCNYTINKKLFSLNRSFKKQNLKRKPEDPKFTLLIKDAEYVRTKYSKFLQTLLTQQLISQNNICDDNGDAIQTANTLYTVSEKNLVTNSLGHNEEDIPIKVSLNGSIYLFPPKCKFYSKDVSEMSDLLINEKYDLIVLDPPWWNKAVRRKNSYKMMYNDDLKSIPIENLLTDDGTVVVWCTNSPQHLDTLLHDVFPKWGVKFAAKWFWMKVTKYGEPIINFAQPPAKLPFEQIIIATKNGDGFQDSSNKVIVSIPSALHSHKPPLIEILSQHTKMSKCIEIFARYLLPGWTSYGLEVLRLQNEDLYKVL